jgi:hypothetical protein
LKVSCLRWELEKHSLVSRSFAVGTLQESHPFNFAALNNSFKLEEVNLRQQEDKSVG